MMKQKRNQVIGLFGSLFALIICILTPFGLHFSDYQQENAKSRENAAKTDVRTPNKPTKVICKLAGKSGVLCEIQQADSEPVSEYTKIDLKAQQDVAEWALLSVFVGITGVVLSFIGVIFVLVTMIMQRHQLAMTRHELRLTEAAQEPYVFGRHIESNLYDWRDKVRPLEWKFCLANYGSTPAVIKSILVKGAYGHDLPPIERFSTSHLHQTGETNVIMAGSETPPYTFYHPERFNNSPHLTSFAAPPHVAEYLFILIEVDYENVAGAKHHLIITWRLNPNMIGVTEVGGHEYNHRAKYGVY